MTVTLCPFQKWTMNLWHISCVSGQTTVSSEVRTATVTWLKLSMGRVEDVPADPSNARSGHEWFTCSPERRSITCTCTRPMSYFSPEGHWSPDNRSHLCMGIINPDHTEDGGRSRHSWDQKQHDSLVNKHLPLRCHQISSTHLILSVF